jgi:cytochrome c biogenesis protein CcmG/thiol:disulfide interchange protein DsbE
MESSSGARWRAQLTGWRGGLFALLGLYAIGATVFLLAGGGQPAMTSLVAMEAEVESGDTAASGGQTGSVDQAGADRAAPDADGSASTAATAPESPLACSDIDPVDHDVDPSLTGVHALGFVTLEEVPAAFAGYEGCPLIVNFFASWCVPCVTEMPDFEHFWNTHGAQVAVLGLAANDRLEDAIATVVDRGVTYPTGLDEGELFIDFGGLGMPTTVFVSPQGEILETHSGLLTLEDITTRAEEHFGL